MGHRLSGRFRSHRICSAPSRAGKLTATPIRIRRRKLMKRTIPFLLLCLVYCGIGLSAQAQEASPLHLVQTLTLDKSVTGKFDHMAVDVKGGRLFLTAAAHGSIEVFDLKAGKWMRSISGLGKPAGITFLPESNRVLFSDGEPGTANVLNAATYKVIGTVKLAAD